MFKIPAPQNEHKKLKKKKQQYFNNKNALYFEIHPSTHIINAYLEKHYQRLCYGSNIHKILFNDTTQSSNPFQIKDTRSFDKQSLFHMNSQERNMYWGTIMEQHVITWLRECFNWQINTCGTFIHDPPHAFIQSRPDGIIVDGIKDHKYACLELKLNATGKVLRYMEEEHYMQCMTHMACSNIPITVFIVWTPEALVMRRIQFDYACWTNHVLPLLVSYANGHTPQVNQQELRMKLAQSIQSNSQIVMYYFKRPLPHSNITNGSIHWHQDSNSFLTRACNEQLVISNIDLNTL